MLNLSRGRAPRAPARSCTAQESRREEKVKRTEKSDKRTLLVLRLRKDVWVNNKLRVPWDCDRAERVLSPSNVTAIVSLQHSPWLTRVRWCGVNTPTARPVTEESAQTIMCRSEYALMVIHDYDADLHTDCTIVLSLLESTLFPLTENSLLNAAWHVTPATASCTSCLQCLSRASFSPALDRIPGCFVQ